MVPLLQIFKKTKENDRRVPSSSDSWLRRLYFALIMIILFLIGDELIKEGHFTLSDFLKPLTHEWLIACISTVLLLLFLARRL